VNLNDVWIALFGKGSPLQKILNALAKIQHELDEIEKGDTSWQRDTTERLQAIKDQLDRIEQDVSGSEAEHLTIEVRQPTEQP